MKWDYWIGHTKDGPVVMWVKNLVKFRGYSIDLHKIVLADRPDCYHTHPAKAIRFVLWGGYQEEVLIPAGPGRWRKWIYRRPWYTGLVTPDLIHRIDSLLKGPSYSLWFRGKVTHDIELVGSGWNTDRPMKERME